VDEYQPCIRINRTNGVQGEQVFGAFQHPAWPRFVLELQELQEALVKPVAGQVTDDIRVEPVAIGRNVIVRIEAQAAKHVGGDFTALLRRGCLHRVQGAEFRRQPLERFQLARDLGDALSLGSGDG
jgi:hypothetical protein